MGGGARGEAALALKRAALAAAAEMAARKRRGDGVESVGSSYLGALVPTISTASASK